MAGEANIGKKAALVIGNSAYQHITFLKNPQHDASAMVAALKRLGFENVISAIDASYTDLLQKLNEFYGQLPAAEIGLLFYAGHGVQVWGRNYLLPCDAHIVKAADLAACAVPLDDVVRAMSRRVNTRLLFLDACRNDPISASSGGLTSDTRSAVAIGSEIADVGEGLARIEAAAGTFVAYATEPGNVALDGEGDNSPFTQALLQHIGRPGLGVDDIMMEVRVDVLDATKGRQLPWTESALTRRFQFTPGVHESSNRNFEEDYWTSIRESNNPDFLDSFLRQFPDSRHVGEARIRLNRVRAQKEKADWQQIASTGRIAALANFVRRYPQSPRAGAARSKLFLWQLWQGSRIVTAGILGAIGLALSFLALLYLALFLGATFGFGDRLLGLLTDPRDLFVSLLDYLLFALVPSIVFGAILWTGLTRFNTRPIARVALAALVALAPTIICLMGLRAIERWSPERMDNQHALEQLRELEKAVAGSKRDSILTNDAGVREQVLKQELILEGLRKQTYASRAYYPVGLAVVAAVAALCALTLIGSAVSGWNGIGLWETALFAGPLGAAVCVFALSLLTQDQLWSTMSIVAYSCWGFITLGFALGLPKTAAAADDSSTAPG